MTEPVTAAASRKRGEALERAIHLATLDELGRVGYDALSIEAVAAGAHTGKASIYRRWQSKKDLVTDALNAALPAYDDPPDTGTVRGDLIEVFRRVAAVMETQSGCAISALMADASKNREAVRSIHEQVMEPRLQTVLLLLRRGVARGEVRAEAVTRTVAEVVPALLALRLRVDGPPLADAVVERLVDEVLLPIVRPCR